MTDIANMQQGIIDLMKLRPVTYRMKADAKKATRFGFIAQRTGRSNAGSSL